jgi:hypothetical protein
MEKEETTRDEEKKKDSRVIRKVQVLIKYDLILELRKRNLCSVLLNDAKKLKMYEFRFFFKKRE